MCSTILIMWAFGMLLNLLMRATADISNLLSAWGIHEQDGNE